MFLILELSFLATNFIRLIQISHFNRNLSLLIMIDRKSLLRYFGLLRDKSHFHKNLLGPNKGQTLINFFQLNPDLLPNFGGH